MTITIFVPAACSARMMLSISCVAPGSRLAVGSSRNRISGRSAHTRASASRCCSPPDSTRAGRSRVRFEADLAQRLAARDPRALARRDAGELQRIRHVAERRCAAAAPAAGTPSPGVAVRPAPPAQFQRDRSRGRLRAGRGTGAAARSCPRRSAPAAIVRGPRSIVSRDAVDDAVASGLERRRRRVAAAAAKAGARMSLGHP